MSLVMWPLEATVQVECGCVCQNFYSFCAEIPPCLTGIYTFSSSWAASLQLSIEHVET
jgi:hypothetical protein